MKLHVPDLVMGIISAATHIIKNGFISNKAKNKGNHYQEGANHAPPSTPR